MLQIKYAILALAIIGFAIAIQDYAVNRQGVQHGIELHHAYSRVATNAHTGHQEEQVIEEVPLAQYPPSPEEINALEEPEHQLLVETEIPVVQENLLAEIEPVGTECPPRATGVYPYLMDCKKFINCWKGQATIQMCPPGTLFNPEAKYCDNPIKVKCVTLDISQTDNAYIYGQQNAKVVQFSNNNNNQFSRNQQHKSAPDVAVEELPAASHRVSQLSSRVGRTQAEDEYYDQDADDQHSVQSDDSYVPSCPPDSIGRHLPHPFDCAKYLHCDITGTFIRDCGPGTHFNPAIEVCDWPQNVKCAVQVPSGSYKKPKQLELDVVGEVNHEDPQYSGIGRIDVRSMNKNQGHYLAPAGTVFIPHTTRRQYQYWTTTPKPYVRFEHQRPSPVYVQTQREPQPQESTIVEQPSRAHQAPIYHREIPPVKIQRRQFFTPSTTTTPTTEITPLAIPKQTVMSVNNYNRAYYNQKQKSNGDDEVVVPGDMATLSDALKMLLKPYIKEGDVNITMPVETRMGNEQKNKEKVSYEVSEEQQHLAGHPEWIESSQEQVEVQHSVQVPRIFVSTTTTTTTSRPYRRPTHQQFQHSPEWHAQHQHHLHHSQSGPHNAEWHRQHGIPLPTNNNQNQQGHHHQGHQHNPEWHRQHGVPLPSNSDTNRYHHGRHHPRYYPTTTETTTPDIPLPVDPRFEEDGASTTPIIHFSRDPKFVIPVTNPVRSTTPKPDVCQGYKCKNSKCIDQNHVCNGKNDCGDRSDEAECPRLGYEVRLSSESGKKHEGRVEVKVFDVWGYVCDDKFDIKAANVLCKELGFEMGAAELRLGSQYAPSASLTDGDETIFIMDEVECNGNETSLKDCDFNGWGVHDCNADEIVGVVCKIPIMSCPADYWLCEMSQECIPTGFLCDNVYDCSDHSDESPKQCNASLEIRLVDGASKHEGRVEVKYRGVWGTICDDDFTKDAADVICRQLGFEGESMVVKSKFGPGKGPIWLDQVKCIGNETSIDDCIHWQWGEHNCAHTEDVGIKCNDGTQRIARTQTGKSKGKLQTRFEDFPYAERSSKLLPEQCGRVKVNLHKEQYHEKVVQSTKTQRGEIPWQASIRAKKQGKSAHWCGAVLISRYHLLTAAHCLIGYPKGAYMVRLGDYRSDEVEPSEIEVFVENLYIHEDFRKGQHMNNDIAIVLLKSPIRFNSYVQPVCLPDKRAHYTPGMNCTISGWGAVQSGSTLTSLDLRAGQVPIQPLHICKQPGVYGEAITEGMFCAGSLEKGVDACDGDSGGPLVCESNGVHTLYGIISWGQHCGFINKPGVYVKVAHYIDWIEQKLEHSKHTFGA